MSVYKPRPGEKIYEIILRATISAPDDESAENYADHLKKRLAKRKRVVEANVNEIIEDGSSSEEPQANPKPDPKSITLPVLKVTKEI